ncbi:MAG TPA: polymer-forming cytoskeletal protein [Edaphobacter sp.]|nr:polymer-forming cytoskeletal protein [Edaphobacter sp.]
MPRSLLALALFLLIVTPVALADQDRASFGSDITVSEGETAGDIACAFCSVHVHGDVKGDIAVLGGSVTVDPDRNIAGDVAILAGDLNLAEDTSVGGDVAIMAGNANVTPSAIIHGSRSILPGRFWLLLPFAPILILIGIIWLIVYLVRRNRYEFPAYPHGRGL